MCNRKGFMGWLFNAVFQILIEMIMNVRLLYELVFQPIIEISGWRNWGIPQKKNSKWHVTRSEFETGNGQATEIT
jgi:hypothetical protein